jgi:uncharacterized protein YuzE
VKVTYDAEVDVFRILLSNAPIEESDEDKPGVILDYDKDGNIVGMEILNASKRVSNPRSVEYAVVGWSRGARAMCRANQGTNDPES